MWDVKIEMINLILFSVAIFVFSSHSSATPSISLYDINSLTFSTSNSNTPVNGVRHVQAEYMVSDNTVRDSPLKKIVCFNEKNRAYGNGSWVCYSDEMPLKMELTKAEVFCEGPNRKNNRIDEYVYQNSCWLKYSLKKSLIPSSSSSSSYSSDSSASLSQFSLESSLSNNVLTTFVKNKNNSKQLGFIVNVPAPDLASSPSLPFSYVILHYFDNKGGLGVTATNSQNEQRVNFYSGGLIYISFILLFFRTTPWIY
jgi:hypothetical protein